jgi:preprotein translocase subunit YajC
MESTMEIIRILLPLVIVGGIAVFVVIRLKGKSRKGTLGKKKKNSNFIG